MDATEQEFVKWAKDKSDSYTITIVEPSSLRDKLPNEKLLGKISFDE
jgi:hypothetical protein